MGNVVVQIFVNKQGLGEILVKVRTPNTVIAPFAPLCTLTSRYSLALSPLGMYATSSGRGYLPLRNFSLVCFSFLLL